MRPERGGELSPKAAAMSELARATLGTMSERDHADGLAALSEQLDRRRRPLRRRLVLAGAGALSIAAAFAILRLGAEPMGGEALSYELDGATVERGGLVRATSGAAPLLYFSDGTVVSLSAGTEARVASVDANGARVDLDGGELRVHVMHRKHAHWTFQAGPFHVEVTGTAFNMGWNRGEGRLDVRMQRGTVSVSGPLAQDPIKLRAGQHLTLKLHEKEVLIREAEPASAPVAVTSAPVAATPVPVTATSAPVAEPVTHRSRPVEGRRVAMNAPAVAVGAPAQPERPAWASLLVAGDLPGILDDAERIGLETALRTRDSADLAALADAARYRGQPDLARRALLVQMQRFPGTARATDAAFQLGRLEESAGAAQRALGWYQRYLREAPEGTYASEALGREMGVLQALYGKDSARAAAEQYLRQFPSGSYAQAARALTRAP